MPPHNDGPSLRPTNSISASVSTSQGRKADSVLRELRGIPRILLVRLRSLGDSILTLPLIEALHSWRPELELDVLVETPFASVFEYHPAIHEVLKLKARHPRNSAGWSRLRALWEIWKRRYRAVLNLHGGTTSMLFTIAGNSRLRLGQRLHRGSWIYNAPIPSSSSIWQRQSLHTVEHQLTIMRWLGLPLPIEPKGFLYVSEEVRYRIQKRLARIGVSKYFLIHPTATLATKQWKPEYFGQLGDIISRKYGLPVIYTASPHEKPILEEIQRGARESHVFWADLPLMDLFALIEGCSLFIGNDSGPTHAAAALNRPIVVVWGSSNFQAWHPWKAPFEAVRSDLPCIPCPGYVCKMYQEPKCILDITVTSVANACERMLDRISKD